MRDTGIDWRMLLGAVAAAALAAGGALYWRLRRPPDLEEAERQRRSHLNLVGRIVEGEVVEILDAPPRPAQPAADRKLFRKKKATAPGHSSNDGGKIICYSYSISGVTYETAQDITGLEERACLDRLVAGQPASVKYDPANPSNSILVADDWSGLR